MTREEAKELFKNDRDAYGKPRSIMHKIDQIYDDFENEKQVINNQIAQLKNSIIILDTSLNILKNATSK